MTSPVRKQESSAQSSGCILIAWAPGSARLVELASFVNGKPLFLSIMFGKKWAAPLRYFLLLIRTISVVRKLKPKVVVAQNPPIFCPMSLLAARPLTRFRLVVDHHAVWSLKTLRQPLLSQVISFLERFVVSRADGNTSANKSWSAYLRKMGAKRVLTLHDFVPRTPKSNSKGENHLSFDLPRYSFLVVAAHGGHRQELIEEEAGAMKGWSDGLLVITGKPEKLEARIRKIKLPPNVLYAGYLREREYESLKRRADVGLALSKEPHTISHALHEFLACGVPTVVLKDSLLRSVFDGSIVEVEDARPETIRSALRRLTEDSGYRKEVLTKAESNYELRSAVHEREVRNFRELLEVGAS